MTLGTYLLDYNQQKIPTYQDLLRLQNLSLGNLLQTNQNDNGLFGTANSFFDNLLNNGRGLFGLLNLGLGLYTTFKNIGLLNKQIDLYNQQLQMSREQWQQTKDELNRIRKVRENMNKHYFG